MNKPIMSIDKNVSAASTQSIAATMQSQQKSNECAEPLFARGEDCRVVGDAETSLSDLKHNDSQLSLPIQAIRQRMQDKLFQLIQHRCSVQNPKSESIALEKLLFQSVDGNETLYSEILEDPAKVVSTLRDVGTKILLRRLQKRKLGGFRSKMVLTKVPAMVVPPDSKTDNKMAMRTDLNHRKSLIDHDDDLSSCITNEKSTNEDVEDDDSEPRSSRDGPSPISERYQRFLIESLQISMHTPFEQMDCDESDQTFSNFAAV